jgi:two-component system phosphate regulon response regulator PhoB
MLPGMDGFEVAQSIKSDPRTQSIPIIMLTAKTSESDVVAGLELGADDYITKPFSPTIVVARAKAVLRQTVTDFSKKKGVLNLNNVYIDLRKHTVYAKGTPVNLTYTEFQVLSLLANRPGWAFSRSQIVNAIKGDNYLVTDRSVDVQIVGLRKKLGECGNIIETVRGVGYKLKDPYFP